MLVILCILLTILLIAAAYAYFSQKVKFEKEKTRLETKNILDFCEENKHLRKLRHDFINQNFTVDLLLQKNDISSARAFLSSKEARFEDIIPKNFCNDYTVNGILLFESEKCKKNGISLNCNANVSGDKIKLSDDELCVLFNSLFDTAIKNCENQDNSEIDLVCKTVNSTLFININFASKKLIKIKNAEKTVKKYNGKLDYKFENGKENIKLFI